MMQFNPDAPLDMTLLQTVAAHHPDPLGEFAHVLALWRHRGAVSFRGAWGEALAHYEGAMPDEVSRHLAAMQLAFAMCGIPIVNPIKVPDIRSVDENGVAENGDGYTGQAVPELVDRGLAFNVPVFVRYPDGRLLKGNEVRFTDTAVKMLEADLKASVLPEDHWRQH